MSEFITVSHRIIQLEFLEIDTAGKYNVQWLPNPDVTVTVAGYEKV